jgi:hypothetical protein
VATFKFSKEPTRMVLCDDGHEDPHFNIIATCDYSLDASEVFVSAGFAVSHTPGQSYASGLRQDSPEPGRCRGFVNGLAHGAYKVTAWMSYAQADGEMGRAEADPVKVSV